MAPTVTAYFPRCSDSLLEMWWLIGRCGGSLLEDEVAYWEMWWLIGDTVWWLIVGGVVAYWEMW